MAAELADPSRQQLVFVGGLHRSGTTLLARLIAEHPQVSGFRDTGRFEDEGQHLQDVLAPAYRLGGPGAFAHVPGAHLTEHDVHDRADAAARLLSAWSPLWDLSKPVLVEKSPPNLLRTRFLQTLFPTASFVVIVRHPIAVAHATQFWAKSETGPLIEHWLHAHETFERDRPAIERLAFVRYEDLVAGAEGTLARIDALLGLPPHQPATPIRSGTNDRYFRRFSHSRVLPARLKILPAVRRYEARVRALGYGYSMRDCLRHG